MASAADPSPSSGAAEGDNFSPDELLDAWGILSQEDRATGFRLLDRAQAGQFLIGLTGVDQADLILGLPPGERGLWVRFLAPDDAADMIQAAPSEKREQLMALLDDATRREVSALLAYAEDAAGGLMNPRFSRVRPDMSVDESIAYLRKQAQTQAQGLYYVYVLDSGQHLLGVLSFRELFAAPGDRLVSDVMHRDVTSVTDDAHQRTVSRLFTKLPYVAIPVVDGEGRMKGVVTADDIVEVVEEEATQDIQKLGGMEALSAPYLEIGFFEMIKKRAGWLALLFIGELLTATAMTHFEKEIARAVVLALFIPLIISSGGNSGSQATTLVIRAMALGEVRLRDVFRVVRREIGAGLFLGCTLGSLGFARITLWEGLFHTYGEHYMVVAMTVGCSLVGVVLWGTVSGALLPFLLRRVGADPASASAPLVATLVDVSGLVIYFSTASLILNGSLL
jgi:magnesium transporter